MQKHLATLSASVCLCVLSPVSSLAQSRPFYLRLSPEVGLVQVEHHKTLTDASGSSSTSASSTGADLLANLSIGQLKELSDNWLLGGELQFAVSARQEIKGSIPAMGIGPGGVGVGTWEFSNRVGVGVNLLVGRRLANGDMRSYLVFGIKRWTTETVSEAPHPVHGPFSDTQVGKRWPWSLGVGFTLPGRRSVDFRLRYSRSAVDWSVRRTLDPEPQPDDPNPEMVTWDYRFTANGISLQIGFGTG
ncbi:MAG: hypothetical protein OXQ94_18835 [Gemmatimonadota bacterium]|nr:hypothetical protein [Gemmatimonadota bacterium]MDE2873729.1 hypothetical protein [Gemmatimonadota bacterium]